VVGEDFFFYRRSKLGLIGLCHGVATNTLVKGVQLDRIQHPLIITLIRITLQLYRL
jgi:hypothetical protein